MGCWVSWICACGLHAGCLWVLVGLVIFGFGLWVIWVLSGGWGVGFMGVGGWFGRCWWVVYGFAIALGFGPVVGLA